MKQESFREHEDRSRFGTIWRVLGPVCILLSLPVTIGAWQRGSLSWYAAGATAVTLLFIIRTALAWKK
ncbi:hypothetical protein KKD52_09815 [Myxococcota bacterium]|jgi:hypothetical protein|nr:hypothetical protein [Myxococcota bacterium]MBU1411440.1 hypothetical protein [Myxococcota bacterium]MBU1510643.1 hypothetical protein [Myxococcota bacterium]PKN26474.1 MAG: hypothetical protein CVU65_05590 [Deltaproteobacteria bacterium HGW-Deltaproteobacteria-22]